MCGQLWRQVEQRIACDDGETIMPITDEAERQALNHAFADLAASGSRRSSTSRTLLNS
jgi:hypothetical protein